jgi:hypothetical protein
VVLGVFLVISYLKHGMQPSFWFLGGMDPAWVFDRRLPKSHLEPHSHVECTNMLVLDGVGWLWCLSDPSPNSHLECTAHFFG